MVNHESIADGLTHLRSRGYTQKFRRGTVCLCCIELQLWVTPVQFNVDDCYYYENTSNPDADRVLYAITTAKGVRGILIEASGVYADNISCEMVQKLELRGQKGSDVTISYINPVESW